MTSIDNITTPIAILGLFLIASYLIPRFALWLYHKL